MTQQVVSYYVAPIALMEDLIVGATVSGTINGVQVSGTVKARRVALYKIATVGEAQTSGGSLKVAEIGGDAGNYQIALEKQPESDLTIHLTQTAPAHAVTIPEEYLELTETNAAIAAAQTTADAAQSTADTAKTTAEMAVSVRKQIVVLRDSTGTKIQSATWSTVIKGPTISIFANTGDEFLTDETYATANLSLGPFNPIYKGIEGFPDDSVVGIIYNFNVVDSIPIIWGYATKRLNSVNLVPASANKVIPHRMLILFIQPCTTL